jgi:corrinoid protein of di/trimethylamine methyltransferase
MENSLLTQLKQAVIDSDSAQTVELTKQAIDAGFQPLEIINQGLVEGMQVVGDKYECGEYFLPHLIIAADGMKKAMALLEPELQSRGQQAEKLGTVVIGTVHGDIHEIGKTLVGTMLSANGFEVHDLGVDVKVEDFINKVKETQANAIGMSALLTTTMTVQRDVIEALEANSLRSSVKVVVGGAPVTAEWADRIGADGHADDAVAAVNLLKKLLT